MTKKIAARIISNTDKEEYADVEALKQIRITRHNIWKDDMRKRGLRQLPGLREWVENRGLKLIYLSGLGR